MGRRIVVSGLCLAIVAGCGKPAGPKRRRPETKKDRFVFAVIPKLLDNPVFRLAHAGAKDKAKQIGGNVTVLWRGPKEGDVAKQQVEIVQTMIQLGVDGIAISVAADTPSMKQAMKEALNRAVALDMAVVCFDSDCPSSLRHAYYGTNDLEGGRTCARELVKVMGDKGTVAILNGLPDAPNTKRREDGAREVLKQHPDIEVLETYYCDDDVAKAVKKIQEVTQAEGHRITGWIFVGGWPLFSSTALDCLKGRGTKVVSFDTLPEQWPFLEKGLVQVLIGQKYYGWGAESVTLLKSISERLAAGHRVKPTIHYAGLDIVTKANLPEYKEQYYTWFPEARPKAKGND